MIILKHWERICTYCSHQNSTWTDMFVISNSMIDDKNTYLHNAITHHPPVNALLMTQLSADQCFTTNTGSHWLTPRNPWAFASQFEAFSLCHMVWDNCLPNSDLLSWLCPVPCCCTIKAAALPSPALGTLLSVSNNQNTCVLLKLSQLKSGQRGRVKHSKKNAVPSFYFSEKLPL